MAKKTKTYQPSDQELESAIKERVKRNPYYVTWLKEIVDSVPSVFINIRTHLKILKTHIAQAPKDVYSNPAAQACLDNLTREIDSALPNLSNDQDVRTFVARLKKAIAAAPQELFKVPASNERSFFTIIKGSIEGIPQVLCSDQTFFACLQDDPDCLFLPAYRRKIKEWQAQLKDPDLDSKKKNRVKANLKRIGEVLAYEGQGRPKKLDATVGDELFGFGDNNPNHIDNVMKKCKEIFKKAQISLGNSALLIKEHFPDVADHREKIAKAKTLEEMRDMILGYRYDVSPKAIRNFISEELSIIPGKAEATSLKELEDMIQAYKEGNKEDLMDYFAKTTKPRQKPARKK